VPVATAASGAWAVCFIERSMRRLLRSPCMCFATSPRKRGG
jgi:hypothetical protein